MTRTNFSVVEHTSGAKKTRANYNKIMKAIKFGWNCKMESLSTFYGIFQAPKMKRQNHISGATLIFKKNGQHEKEESYAFFYYF